jgi:hypothetical protein
MGTIVEPTSLLQRIAQGKLPPLEAAALSYLPTLSVRQRHLVEAWSEGGHAILTHYLTMEGIGTIGLFALPIEVGALYIETERVLHLCKEAIQQAQNAGAGMIALTGLLPSATYYGRAFKTLPGDEARVTTGHAFTASAVVMTIERLLEQTNRSLSRECVAFLGLGSIGKTVLRLMLDVLPHPREILLCDLYGTHMEWTSQLPFRGSLISLATVDGGVPERIYAADVIVGATNASNLLKVPKLRPGTLVFDDSSPHCFAPEQACQRMQIQGDVLLVEAGEFETTTRIQERLYAPNADTLPLLHTEELLALRDDHRQIWGCLCAGLLTTAWNLPPTIGEVSPDVARQCYWALKQHGWKGAWPHLQNERLPEALIERFRECCGKVPAQ